jgi:hypothetical protein
MANNKFGFVGFNIRTNKKPTGYSSEAAKAAFRDILNDPDMKVTIEIYGSKPHKISMILNENILGLDF